MLKSLRPSLKEIRLTLSRLAEPEKVAKLARTSTSETVSLPSSPGEIDSRAPIVVQKALNMSEIVVIQGAGPGSVSNMLATFVKVSG